MIPDIDPVVRTIAAALEAPVRSDSLRPIARDSAITVSDATLAFLIEGRTPNDHAVLLVSNPAFPDAVGDAIARGRRIANSLDDATASHIVQPRESGVHQGQSWGLYPRLEPMSGHRALRIVQKKSLTPRVATWLGTMAEQTRTPARDQIRQTRFANALEVLSQDPDLDHDIRTSAKTAHAALDAHPVMLVAEHGDFWSGNVLLSQGSVPGFPADFHVIDWGGARTDGYPCIDLLRYAMSLYRPGTRQPGQLLRSYMDRLNIPDAQGALYPMAAMGYLGQNLDQFPRARYLDLVRRVHGTLKTAGLA